MGGRGRGGLGAGWPAWLPTLERPGGQLNIPAADRLAGDWAQSDPTVWPRQFSIKSHRLAGAVPNQTSRRRLTD